MRPPATPPTTCASSSPTGACLISGDHLLGRISLFFDYGYSPDPVGEFLGSLDTVEGLSARLCLAGHGRTFADVQAHIRGNRGLVQERLDLVQGALQEGEQTAFEIIPARLRRRAGCAQRPLAALGNALLPDPPAGRGPGAADRGRAGALEGCMSGRAPGVGRPGGCII